jgi:hypothetical protein
MKIANDQWAGARIGALAGPENNRSSTWLSWHPATRLVFHDGHIYQRGDTEPFEVAASHGVG